MTPGQLLIAWVDIIMQTANKSSILENLTSIVNKTFICGMCKPFSKSKILLKNRIKFNIIKKNKKNKK